MSHTARSDRSQLERGPDVLLPGTCHAKGSFTPNACSWWEADRQLSGEVKQIADGRSSGIRRRPLAL
jgi:hypothetical protein